MKSKSKSYSHTLNIHMTIQILGERSIVRKNLTKAYWKRACQTPNSASPHLISKLFRSLTPFSLVDCKSLLSLGQVLLTPSQIFHGSVSSSSWDLEGPHFTCTVSKSGFLCLHSGTQLTQAQAHPLSFIVEEKLIIPFLYPCQKFITMRLQLQIFAACWYWNLQILLCFPRFPSLS